MLEITYVSFQCARDDFNLSNAKEKGFIINVSNVTLMFLVSEFQNE